MLLDSSGSSTTTPFPGGSARWSNIGTHNGQAFDLYITAVSEYTYVPAPDTSTTTYASTYNGLACVTIGVPTTTCTNGGALPAEGTWIPSTNPCSGEESAAVTGGAQYTFQLVQTGTTTLMP